MMPNIYHKVQKYIELKEVSVKQSDFDLTISELHLAKGDFVGILGNNGSGKSTFLHMLTGLKPFKGQYKLSDIEFHHIHTKKRSQLISFLPQSVNLNMPFSVFYVVLTGRFPWTAGSRYSKDDVYATENMLKQLDIFHLQKRLYYELSGGEKQRVLIARTLNRDSPVIVLDEPLSGIDIKHQQEAIQYLRSLSHNKLILVVIHDLPLAIRTFDRFLFFINGTLAHDLRKSMINESLLFEVFGVKLNILKQDEKVVVYL